eukprot:SAG31_NODE_43585_length_266_cov_0.928144_1_plen_38_part_10
MGFFTRASVAPRSQRQVQLTAFSTGTRGAISAEQFLAK